MNFHSNFRDQFEAINGRLLEAKKAVRERDRIQSLMASLDDSLAKEKKELETLTAQLEEARARLEELEGLTWTAVWQKLVGNHEEELSEEAEKLAVLKMTHEASEIKTQSIQTSLQEFETGLVDLAECDEELTAVQTEQQAFLVANGRLPAEKIHNLNRKMSEGQTFLREATEALILGEKALNKLVELQERLADAQIGTMVTRPKPGERSEIMRMRQSFIYLVGAQHKIYSGMGAIVTAAGEIQPLLDLFQLELQDVDYQMTPPPNLTVFAYGDGMLKMKNLYLQYGSERSRRIEAWRAHLQTLERRLSQKVNFLKNKCGHWETAVATAQTRLHTLIEQHWQEIKNE
jgi:hypothetical protein